MVVGIAKRGIDTRRNRFERGIVRHRSAHLAETGSIPKLVAEIASELDVLFVKQNVLTERRGTHCAEAERVGTVARDEVERVGRIAERFRHFTTEFVAHDSREIYVAEGHFTAPFKARHDHACDPEENDIRAGNEVARRIEFFQKFRHFGIGRIHVPAHCCKRPEPRGEPGVEHVRILFPVFGVSGRCNVAVNFRGIALGIPHGNAVSPPKLAGNAPVLQVAHPVFVNFAPAFRVKFHSAGSHAFAGGGNARIFQKPLLGKARLNRYFRAFADPDFVFVRFFLDEQTEFAEKFDGFIARLEAFHSREIFPRECVHRAVGIHNVRHFEIVAATDFKVRFVVRGRNFKHAGSEFKLDGFVADDRDRFLIFARERTNRVLADVFRVAFILRINGDCGVARNRFGARRRNRQKRSRFFGDFDFEIIKETFVRLHDDFFVRERRKRCRAPVHHAFAAVNVAFFVKVDKDFLNATRVAFVHREAFPRPVAGATELFELVDDDPAFFFFPIPNALKKRFAPEVVARFAFRLFELFFNHDLRGDARVVRAREPKDFFAVETRFARENVLNRIVEHMPHVKHARNVRRRDDDGIRRAAFAYARGIGGKAAFIDPVFIPTGFDLCGFVIFRNVVRHRFKKNVNTQWYAFLRVPAN